METPRNGHACLMLMSACTLHRPDLCYGAIILQKERSIVERCKSQSVVSLSSPLRGF